MIRFSYDTAKTFPMFSAQKRHNEDLSKLKLTPMNMIDWEEKRCRVESPAQRQRRRPTVGQMVRLELEEWPQQPRGQRRPMARTMAI